MNPVAMFAYFLFTLGCLKFLHIGMQMFSLLRGLGDNGVSSNVVGFTKEATVGMMTDTVTDKVQTKKTAISPKVKEMMQEAAIALNKLGVPTSRANSIVKDLCKNKAYSSAEDLIKDAIVYM